MSPQFSIIIPVYNVAPYLRGCLDSVLAAARTLSEKCEVRSEKWNGGVEVICVDDGSTDGSGAILDEYAAQMSCIRVIHQANAGVSAARNAALDIATGEWVMMLDGDDTWAEDLLGKVVGEIDAHPDCDAVCFGMVCVNEKGERTKVFAKTAAKPAVMTGDEVLLDGRGPYSKFIWSSCDKAYRRATLERIGLRYTVGMRHEEDSLFSQVFLAHAGKVVLRPDIEGYRYLMREGSAIHTQKTALPEHPFRVFETLYAHWQKLRTPGLRLRLYYTAVGYPALGKGDDYAPGVRTQAIELLLSSRLFNRTIMPFCWRCGGWKARLFVTAYLLAPRFLRKILLEMM